MTPTRWPAPSPRPKSRPNAPPSSSARPVSARAARTPPTPPKPMPTPRGPNKPPRPAKKQPEPPPPIVCKARIGQGSPNRANSAKAHGEPLGAEEVALARAELGWTSAPFVVEPDIYAAWDGRAKGQSAQAQWNERFAAYGQAFPALAAEFRRRMQGQLPAHFEPLAAGIERAADGKRETVASRRASQLALQAFTAELPELLGGSADLTSSNLTHTTSTPALRFDAQGNVKTDAAAGAEAAVGGKIGRHINYGVREFGMAAIMNGLALHGGYIPYGGTFLTFSDYSRNAIRMAALMRQRVIHVFTHDSIGLGEDGPTHQAIEHAASLRLIPHLDVWRPADTVETAVAWRVALSPQHPPARPPRRHRRDRRGLARGPVQPGPAHGPAAEPPEPALSPRRAQARPGRHRPRRLCAERAGGPGPEKETRGRDHRHRLRGATGAAGPAPAGRQENPRARGLHAQHDPVRPPRPQVQKIRSAGPPAPRGR